MRDFDPVDAYVDVLRQVVPAHAAGGDPRAAAAGFPGGILHRGRLHGADRRAGSSPRWASPSAMTAPVFFTHEAGKQHLPRHRHRRRRQPRRGSRASGRSTSTSAPRNCCATRKCDVFFIWDPDGDRFNMVTVAPADLADRGRGRRPRGRSPGRRPLPGLLQAQPDLLHAHGAEDRLPGRRRANWSDYDWIVATHLADQHEHRRDGHHASTRAAAGAWPPSGCRWASSTSPRW